jgi:hypothetical protein
MRLINRDDPREVAFFIVGGLCGALLLFLAVGLSVSLFTMEREQLVSGPLVLSSQWVEIKPDRPLQPLKQAQELVLVVDSSQVLSKNNSVDQVLLTDGSVVNPEIQFLDLDGNAFNAKVIKAPSPSRYENAIIGWSPGERSYAQVRIRSDKPIHLSRVVWHCWNGK